MSYAIELTPEDSRRALAWSSEHRQSVRLQPKGQDEAMVEGQLMTCTEDTLEIITERISAREPAHLLHMYCHVELELPEGQYFFESHILAVAHVDEGSCLSLALPSSILVCQRRRTPRLRLAQDSEVQLSRWEDERLLTCQGYLVNLSEAGIAVRLATADAATVQIGQSWSVFFEVPELNQCYRFESLVRRKVPSGTADAILCGLEFENPDVGHAQVHALEAFLEDRRHAKVPMGGQR